MASKKSYEHSSHRVPIHYIGMISQRILSQIPKLSHFETARTCARGRELTDKPVFNLVNPPCATATTPRAGSNLTKLRNLLLLLLLLLRTQRVKSSRLVPKPVLCHSASSSVAVPFSLAATPMMGFGDAAPSLRAIPAGTLHMGFGKSIPASLGPAAATFPHGDADERPFHAVELSAFALGTTEVTNAQFEQFDPTHARYRGRLNMSRGDDDAVLWVSWEDATAYCAWLTATVGAKLKEPLVYRLPTEAEWEHAARGNESGTRHALYWTGDSVPAAMRNHNDHNAGLPEPGQLPIPTRVGRFAPNSFGLHDTLGNVEEWVHDYYARYPATPQRDPCGPLTGSLRVTRGGSHSTELYYLRSANRAAAVANDRSWFIGFRVAASRAAEGPRCVPSPAPANNIDASLEHVPEPLPEVVHEASPMSPHRRTFVRFPDAGDGGLPFHKHNHDPALVACPGGGLLATWFSTDCGEPGRCTGLVSARLETNASEWTVAYPELDVADRTQCCPSYLLDQRSGILYQFSGMMAAGDRSGFCTHAPPRTQHD